MQGLANQSSALIIVAPSTLQDTTGYVITGGKQKVKSGKYAKHNVNIVQEEVWPHLSVLKKYAKRTSFDNLKFDAFVARETRTILLMKEMNLVLGRLRVLSQIAHWQCTSKNWPLVCNLYKAITESVELGETEWCQNFYHYESQIPTQYDQPAQCEKDSTLGIKEKEKKEKKNTEVYWCKEYQ